MDAANTYYSEILVIKKSYISLQSKVQAATLKLIEKKIENETMKNKLLKLKLSNGDSNLQDDSEDEDSFNEGADFI